MTSARRGYPSLTVPIPSNQSSDLPPISALFLIDFDVKAGYTIVWKRAEPGLELDGLVEYKSLPSGLHTVSQDLIYFVHDGGYAGLSAFVNEPCEEEEARHARMIAVGILVPLSYGRLGRAWRHAEGLESIAHKLAKDRTDTELLEKYWLSNKAKSAAEDAPTQPPSGETPLANPTVSFPDLPTQDQQQQPPKETHTRKRSASDGASLAPAEHKLSPHHPAWSLTRLLDRFGPLIFPIHRAALLRKRILISCHAPVHEVCDFVYDISILSNIPLTVNDILPQSPFTQRLKPLFNIGVHDIPFLTEDFEASKRQEDESAVTDEDDEAGYGWIACTTDSILAMKDTLWDMLITLPPNYSANADDKVWPTVECPRGESVKATQRDLRRFNAMRAGLARLAATSVPGAAPNNIPGSPQSETSDRRVSTSHSNHTTRGHNEATEKLVEPLSWTALAYNGFMWWASAGEQLRSEEQEESTRDAALLADLAPAAHTPMAMPQPPNSRSDPLTDSLASLAARRHNPDGEARVELAIIAYFHRLTTQMLTVLADIVDGADMVYTDESEEDASEDPNDPLDSREGADDDDNDPADGIDRDDRARLLPGSVTDRSSGSPIPGSVTVDGRSVENMGLDVWSVADAVFVQDLTATYFGRVAQVEGKGVEICGVRVC